MSATIQQMIDTLHNIELLAIKGTIPGTLTALTAGMLALELAGTETEQEAMERAEAFVLDCKQITAKAS